MTKKHTQGVDIVHVWSWESGCDAKCDALFPARHNYDSAGVYQHRRYAVRTPAHPWRDLHQRCVRCENSAAQRSRSALPGSMNDGEIDTVAGRAVEPPWRLNGRRGGADCARQGRAKCGRGSAGA